MSKVVSSGRVVAVLCTKCGRIGEVDGCVPYCAVPEAVASCALGVTTVDPCLPGPKPHLTLGRLRG